MFLLPLSMLCEAENIGSLLQKTRKNVMNAGVRIVSAASTTKPLQLGVSTRLDLWGAAQRNVQDKHADPEEHPHNNEPSGAKVAIKGDEEK
jgi:hypothetical protein